MMAGCTHDDKPWLKAADLLKQCLSRSATRLENVQPVRSTVGFQKLGGETGKHIHFAIASPNRDDVDRFTTGQSQKLKCLKRARDLSASAVCNDHAIACWQVARHDNSRPGTTVENLAQYLVRLVQRFEMEIRFAA